MANDQTLTLFHAPNTRSTGALILLEELGAPYELQVLNMTAGEQRQPAYLAINPAGKVPAIRQFGAVVTEQPAIFLYLADQFPKAGLAPAIGDPLRGPYLRWMVFYGAALEPALTDHALKRDSGGPRMSPYGDYDTVIRLVQDQLAQGPYFLGEKMTALDVLWGTALGWTTSFKIFPESPPVMDYIARMAARPAALKVKAMDAALAAKQAPSP